MTGVYYSQNNDNRWKNIPYSKIDKTKTIAFSGCGITSPAMVLSSLLHRNIYPPEIATYSLSNGFRVEGQGTAFALYPALAKKYGLEFKKTYRISELIEWLKDGGMAVMGCAGGSDKVFSDGGHIIAVMGISQDGRIIVHDPQLYYSKFNKPHRKPYVYFDKMDLVHGMDILILPEILDKQKSSGGYNCFKVKKVVEVPKPNKPSEDIQVNKKEEDEEVIYKTINDVPNYWREDIKRLILEGAIKGDNKGNINLPESTAQALVIMLRHEDKRK